MARRKRDAGKEGTRRVENKRLVTAVYVLLRLAVILIMVAQFFNGNYENVFLCVLTLVLFTLPALVERQLRVDLPDTLETSILLSVFEGQPEGYGHHGLQLCDAGHCHDQHAGAGDGYRRRHHRPL